MNNFENKNIEKTDSIKYDELKKINEKEYKIENPIWLSVSEAAKIGGVQNKTIRRAIKNIKVKFKIIDNRYLIDFESLIFYLHTTLKLKNKLNNIGVGQYIEEWKNKNIK